jgi:hypothetical protein
VPQNRNDDIIGGVVNGPNSWRELWYETVVYWTALIFFTGIWKSLGPIDATVDDKTRQVLLGWTLSSRDSIHALFCVWLGQEDDTLEANSFSCARQSIDADKSIHMFTVSKFELF